MLSVFRGRYLGNAIQFREDVMNIGLDSDIVGHKGMRDEGDLRRILLVDDDPVFRSLMAHLGVWFNLDIEAYDSLLEIESFDRMQCYSGAIFDFHLGDLDGCDMAVHLKAFFSGIPTLLVSADENAGNAAFGACGEVFCGFLCKSAGPISILRAMSLLLDESERGQAARHLYRCEGNGHPAARSETL